MYKVYKIEFTEIPQNAKYYYYKSGNKYALLFTNKRVTGKKALSDMEIKTLRPEEKDWLWKSKLQVNAEQLKKNENQYAGMICKFLDVLDKELKKEESAKAE